MRNKEAVIIYNGIEIQVIRKKIKNIHLSVRQDGKVSLSAPFSLSETVIKSFLSSKMPWINKQIDKFNNKPKKVELEYKTGEIVYYFGTPYTLTVIEGLKNSIKIVEENVLFYCKSDSNFDMRKKCFDNWYKNALKEKIPKLLEKWENISSLKCNNWQIRDMKTRWGTYSTQTDKIWLNLQLAKKPIECVEYVVMHELAHTIVCNHGKNFVAIMDKFMPNWKELKKQLNYQLF